MNYKRLRESIDDKLICLALDKGVSIYSLYEDFDLRKRNLMLVYRNPASHYSKILVGAYIGVMNDYEVTKKERREYKI